jgi:hypothetical protein
VLNLDAKDLFFFYATGVTPAMTEKMIGKGSQYAGAFVDAKGNPLDGGKTYRLQMPPNIPAEEFWSFTVYHNQTRCSQQRRESRHSGTAALGQPDETRTQRRSWLSQPRSR